MTRLLFFGRLRDAAGYGERHVRLPSHVRTVEDLRNWIAEADADLGRALRADGIKVAVDQVICRAGDGSVGEASEVAFLPPLSGG